MGDDQGYGGQWAMISGMVVSGMVANDQTMIRGTVFSGMVANDQKNGGQWDGG